MQDFVVPHDAVWAAQFEDEATAIRSALGGSALAIHHIGSTSIPDILAKPIIDILVEVPSLAELDRVAPAMAHHGYEALGAFGIRGRRYFRKDDAGGGRTHHVHAFRAGTPHVVRHLAFRDFLRAHPDVALEGAAGGASGHDARRLHGWQEPVHPADGGRRHRLIQGRGWSELKDNI